MPSSIEQLSGHWLGSRPGELQYACEAANKPLQHLFTAHVNSNEQLLATVQPANGSGVRLVWPGSVLNLYFYR